MRVDVEGVVSWVDPAFFIILLTQRERTSIHTDIIHIRITAHCRLRQSQVLKDKWTEQKYIKTNMTHNPTPAGKGRIAAVDE